MRFQLRGRQGGLASVRVAWPPGDSHPAGRQRCGRWHAAARLRGWCAAPRCARVVGAAGAAQRPAHQC
eukprot:6551455-Pyramimonas_sp.AAC.1